MVRRRLPRVSEPQKKSAQPTVADLEAEIVEARNGLTSSLEQLRAETRPEALAQRGKAAVIGFFTDEYGGVRPDRVAMVAGTLVTLVVLRRWRSARRRNRCHCH